MVGRESTGRVMYVLQCYTTKSWKMNIDKYGVNLQGKLNPENYKLAHDKLRNDTVKDLFIYLLWTQKSCYIAKRQSL